MHLHIGFDATGLENLECHHLVMRNWDVNAPQNVVNISIPSVFDPSMAPKGKHTLHAYLAGNEPWEPWDGLRRGSPEYLALKEERSKVIWEAVEKVIPDIRERVTTSMVGTPVTIKRFCRRDRGTYGPIMGEGMEAFLGPDVFPIKGLYHCGEPPAGTPTTGDLPGGGTVVRKGICNQKLHKPPCAESPASEPAAEPDVVICA